MLCWGQGNCAIALKPSRQGPCPQEGSHSCEIAHFPRSNKFRNSVASNFAAIASTATIKPHSNTQASGPAPHSTTKQISVRPKLAVSAELTKIKSDAKAAEINTRQQQGLLQLVDCLADGNAAASIGVEGGLQVGVAYQVPALHQAPAIASLQERDVQHPSEILG